MSSCLQVELLNWLSFHSKTARVSQKVGTKFIIERERKDYLWSRY